MSERASRHNAVLLANHRPAVAGKTLDNVFHATEELGETAKLYLVLRGMEISPLTPEQIDGLHKRFPLGVQATPPPTAQLSVPQVRPRP